MYKGRVNVIGLPVDVRNRDGSTDGNKVSVAKNLMEGMEAYFTNIIESDSVNESIMKGISVVPTTFFVDSDGYLTGSIYTGSKSASEWSKIINEML